MKTEDQSEPEFLQLPAPSDDTPTLHLGETKKLDHLGPVIINTDGTTSRVANWDKLTEMEQQVALKRVSKRNRQRKEKLLMKQNEVSEVQNQK